MQDEKAILAEFEKLAVELYQDDYTVSPWQWVEENRTLPTSAAEGGKMRFDRTPWVRWITDAIANLKYQEVITTQGSQFGKTETLINTRSEVLDCIYVVPPGENLPTAER